MMKKRSKWFVFTILALILVLIVGSMIPGDVLCASPPGANDPHKPDDPSQENKDKQGDTNPQGPSNQENDTYQGEQQNQEGKPGQDDQDTSDDTAGQGNGIKQKQEQNSPNNSKDEGKRDQKQERYEQRSLSITRSMNQTHIRSSWQKDTDQDSFELLIDTKDTLQIYLGYTIGNDTGKKDLEYHFLFKDIIEFEDINGNGWYDEKDTIRSRYSIEDAAFTKMALQNMTDEDGVDISVLSTGTIDKVFTIRFYATERYAYIHSTLCSPNEIKMDFIIDTYPYQSNTSFLSLSLELQTYHMFDLFQQSYNEQKGYASNESELRFSSENSNGFFSWSNSAIINTNDTIVTTLISSEKRQMLNDTDIEENTSSTIQFIYPNAEIIVHDPKIGVVSISSDVYASIQLLETIELMKSVSLLSYILVCLLAAACFVGAIYYKKKIQV